MKKNKPKKIAYRVLLVDDDVDFGKLLKETLRLKGYQPVLCCDAESGLDRFTAERFDLCIIEVSLPGKDGYLLAAEIRQADVHVPVIFVTGKSEPDDLVRGFKAGCDDYLVKPFNMEELLLRVKALLRRTSSLPGLAGEASEWQIGRCRFDAVQRTLQCEGGESRHLTSKETDLLRLLCLNLNRTLERSLALKAIWGEASCSSARSMDVYITRLRKLLRDDPNLALLNVHSKGFKLVYTGSADRPDDPMAD